MIQWYFRKTFCYLKYFSITLAVIKSSVHENNVYAKRKLNISRVNTTFNFLIFLQNSAWYKFKFE